MHTITLHIFVLSVILWIFAAIIWSRYAKACRREKKKCITHHKVNVVRLLCKLYDRLNVYFGLDLCDPFLCLFWNWFLKSYVFRLMFWLYLSLYQRLISSKKLCSNASQIFISVSVSIQLREKIRYMLLRWQPNCCASHETRMPFRVICSLMSEPICSVEMSCICVDCR